MSLSPAEVGRLVALGSPVLCVDTCTILDVIRDVTRETVNLADVQAGLLLLHAAETQTKLVILMAEQVSAELSDNLSDVEQEAERKLGKLIVACERSLDCCAFQLLQMGAQLSTFLTCSC